VLGAPEDREHLESLGVKLVGAPRDRGSAQNEWNCIVDLDALKKLDEHFGRYIWSLSGVWSLPGNSTEIAAVVLEYERQLSQLREELRKLVASERESCIKVVREHATRFAHPANDMRYNALHDAADALQRGER